MELMAKALCTAPCSTAPAVLLAAIPLLLLELVELAREWPKR